MPTRTVLRWSFAGLLGAALAIAGCGGTDEASISTGDYSTDAASGDTGAGGSSGGSQDGSTSGDSTTGNTTPDGSMPDVSVDAGINNDAALADDVSVDDVSVGDVSTTGDGGSAADAVEEPVGCGTPCTNGDVCLQGSCVPNCVTPQVLCNGASDGGADAALSDATDDSAADSGNPAGFYCANPASDAKNCGGCGKVCPVAGETCDNSVCGCPTGQKICAASNSCIDNASCCDDSSCTRANATEVCSSGTCKVTGCATGFSDCDKDANNGCEVGTVGDPNNCGTCGKVCAAANGTPGCANSLCTVVSCNTGFENCNNDVTDGCEVDKRTDVGNCGTCGHVCVTANGTPACITSACAVATCNAGFVDCDGNPTNGCEVSTVTDPNNCGVCGNICSVANGVAGCANSQCTVATCNVGYTNCDNNVTTGCEVNTGGDVNNCGTCGNVCNVANATPSCTTGNCTVGVCNAGYTNCNGSPTDGCEVHTSVDPLHCGLCTTQCFVANGTAGCAAGACTVASCNPNFGDCDGLVSNGCETDLRTSTGNCGSCGHNCNSAAICSAAGGALMTCNASSCQVLGCGAGRFDIDKSCADGCECISSGTSSTCGSPTNLGTLNVGLSTSYSGNLVPTGQEAYLTVTFQGNTNFNYHPHIRMTTGSAEFIFDVLTNCAGGQMSCNAEGGTSGSRTDWEVLYTAGDPASYPLTGSNFQPMPAVGMVIIHVYRRAGQPLTCNNYTLTISN